MYKFVLASFLLLLFSLNSSAQLTHGGRGMYVDKFFRTTVNTSGSTIINQNHSILSIAAKEDSLLQYCKDNHITYLILYDLHYVFGNTTYESYLCSFMQKAKTNYCIEKIGVASSCAGMFDNVSSVAATPPVVIPESRNSDFKDKVSIALEMFQPEDSLFYLSEVTKLSLRVAAFNDFCAYKFDVLVTEFEFWSSSADDCIGDNPSKDVKYQRYQAMITTMDDIRDDYNTSHPGHQLYVETYLGYINQNTAYSHQTIANWIDGSYSGKRRVDRILLHYYASDATKMYSRTSAGQNNSGYYLTRFLDFCQSTTNNQSNVFPIMSSEYVPWGASFSFLGSWFHQNANNNIFTAEKIWYDDWFDDAQNFNPGTVGSATLGSVIKPGGALWFTARQMMGHLNKPVMFTSNSPVCVASGQNGSLQFTYQGPIEQGLSYKFYVTNAGGSTVVCGTTNPVIWPVYNGVTQTALNLNAALGSCTLPVGEYDAHLELTYATGCTYIVPLLRVSVVTTNKIVALTATTACQGNPVFLQAGSTGGGTTTYAWYDNGSQISGATSSTFAPSPTASGTHNYSCRITSSIGTCTANLSNAIPITINPYPTATISTLSSSGCSVVLQSNPTGNSYVWQDGSTGGTYTTTHTGTYTVAVTSNGCTNIASYSYKRVSIDKVTQTSSCFGGQNGSVTVNLYNGSTPYSLSWSGPVNGNMTGLSGGNRTITNLAPGTYTIIVTDVSGCTKTLSPNVVIASNSQINVTTSSTGATCSGSSNGSASVTGVTGGNGSPYTYRWHFNNSTSNTLSGIPPGTYLVDVMDAFPCTTTSSINVSFTNTNVTPAVSIAVSPGTSNCAGTSVTFTASPTNGGSSPSYQWKKNGSNVGSNSPSYVTTTLVNNDVITCVMTSSASCPTPASVSSNSITMTVNSAVSPTISISANPGTTNCAGTNVTFTANITNGGPAPFYQWRKNGSNVGTNSATFITSALINNDVISCVLTSNAPCASPVTRNSNSLIMTVTPNVTPTITISASTGNSICPGTSVSFSAVITNGGSSPSYQWKRNGTNISNSTVYTTSTIANNEVITCVLTSNASCITSPTANSNTITMTVNPDVTPSVSVSSNSGTTICSGTNVTFTAIPTNGGSSPSYQWKKNGANVGTNSPNYTTSSIASNDNFSCVLTSNAPCASPTTATNSIVMTVTPNVIPTISISASPGNSVCSGESVTFTATISNGGSTPIYQWKKNGTNVGINQSTYTTTAIAQNDFFSCQLTSNANCAFPTTVTSNNVSMTILPDVSPAITISSVPGNSICEGDNVIFSANVSNGGSTPVYQWKLNGSNVGTNSNSYSNNALSSNDQIICELTSNANCASPLNASSNVIIMTVNMNSAPSLTINSNSGNSVCEGANVTFTAIPVNGGTSPSYQWKLNGTNVGANSNTYSNNSLQNNDIIECELASNASCISPGTVSSNMITMTVTPNVTPVITIASGTGLSICSGESLTFDATVSNAGISPVYQWKKNGIGVGTNSSVFTTSSLSNNDVITCDLTSNVNCAFPLIVTSNTLTVVVLTQVAPSVTISADPGNTICVGTNVIFTATPIGGGSNPTYEWKKNGFTVGTNSDTYSDFLLVQGDNISCTMTSNSTCISTSTVNSNVISITVQLCGATLSLKLFLQGYYLGSNTMKAVIDPILLPLTCDTIIVELRSTTSPFHVNYTLSGVIDIYGYGLFNSSNVILNQDYYLVVRHRNSLETWSKDPVQFNTTMVSYDFTTSANKAFGDNLIDLGDGNFAFWSGDISDGINIGVQDDAIDQKDLSDLILSMKNFENGYTIGDLTGDGLVESADFSLLENNVKSVISIARP
jgi:hypothetical protein